MLLKIISKLLVVSLLCLSITLSYADNVSSSTFSYEKNKKVKKVIVTGIGTTDVKAIKSASQAAVQQVVGMYVVSDVVMQNRKLIKDEILSTSNGFVKSFKVLNKTKDEDGLFEVEAEVEVEINKLTKRLSDLNVALKNVGTDSFKAVSLDKFTSLNDFKKMAEKVIFEPIQNNRVWDLKILDLQPLSEDFEYRQSSLFKRKEYNDWLPFMLTIKASASKDYHNSVMQFIEKNSNEITYDWTKAVSGQKNYISFGDILLKYKGNRKKPILNIRKNYEMTNKQADILSSLYKKNIKKMGLKVSLYNQDGLFKQSVYKNYLKNPASHGVDFPLYLNNYIYDNGKPILNKQTSSLSYMAPIVRIHPLYKSFTFPKNDLTIGILLLLSEDDVEQLKDIKIEFVTFNR